MSETHSKDDPKGLATVPSGMRSGALVVQAVNRTTGKVLTCTPGHPFAILGRAPHAGVRLDDPSVSQSHAYLQIVDGLPYVIDLGSRTGVLWDDGNQGRGWVHPGQTLQIGIFEVQITCEGVTPLVGAEGEVESTPYAALDIHSPGTVGGRFSLDTPVTLIGRHPNCGLRFIDEAVAYFQCAIVNSRDGLWCVDLLSRRGTVLNGRAVRVARLRDGDLIEVGRVSLVAHLGTEEAAIVPQRGVTSSAIAHTQCESQFGTAPVPAALFEPLREMMEQFQQSFVTMARMFTTMQQEHTAMMCEQMRQVQEMLREVREGRPITAPPSPLPASTPAPNTTSATPATKPPAEPKTLVPRSVGQDEGKLLADAHAWFLSRLTQNNPASGKPE